MTKLEKPLGILVFAILLAVFMVALFTLVYLTRGLPNKAVETSLYPASKLTFAFGSGQVVDNRMRVQKFENGYALLSSGPVSVKAEIQDVLSYSMLPSKWPREAAFFWRRSDAPANVIRSEITSPGERLIDLSTESDWKGTIIELGFLLAGNPEEPIDIGDLSLSSESLTTRLQLMWQAWTTFEDWSQQSINFLFGGDQHQVISLPVLITSLLSISLLLLWLLSPLHASISSRQLLSLAGLVFISAWMILDIRWSANNIKHIRQAFQQQSGVAIDDEVRIYTNKLKNRVLGDKPARIVIMGDGNTGDYYLLRTKYHLLPHSGNVMRSFTKRMSTATLDFIICIGEPGSITRLKGWNNNWQKRLTEIERDEWGVVYRVN